MRRDIIEKIITAGTQASSGSNSQPWKFEVDGDRILILALPERDHPTLNYRYRGTWVAIGALLENMTIAAQAFNASATITLFPDPFRPEVTASMVLRDERREGGGGELYPYIALRGTNRKAFEKIPLSNAELDVLQKSTAGYSGASVRWITDVPSMKQLATAASKAEVLMLEDKALHELFFKEIVWSRTEEQARGGGLYIETMEIPAPARFALRHVFRHWGLMKFFVKLGIPRKIAAGNAATYAASSAMGAIVVPNVDGAFFDAGRALERVWLTATKLGLSFHLITGIPFFWQRVTLEGGSDFSDEHVTMIHDAYRTMHQLASVRDHEVVAILFRVGKDGKPTARSQKRNPDIHWK